MFGSVNEAKLLFKEIVCLHGLLISITFNQYVKFISYFWVNFGKRLKAKLNFTLSYHP